MRITHFITATVLLCMLCPALEAANDIRFYHITAEDGLSNNQVNALYQDSRDFIWIGTSDGLNLYNGKEIKVFKYDKYNDSGMFDNNVRYITGDGKDRLVIQNDFGIVSYDITENRFSQMVSGPVGAICFDKDLYYSVGNKVVKLDDSLHTREIACYLPDDTAIVTALHKSGDSLMVGTDKGLFLSLRGGEEFCTSVIPGVYVYDIFKDSRGTYWVTSYDRKGLFSIDRDGNVKQFRHSDSDPYSISHDQTHRCCEDKDGNIWIGTFLGLSKYDIRTGKFTSWLHSDKEESLSESSIWCMLTDRQGNIWAGTYYGGVNYFSPSRRDFRKYRAGSSEKDFLSSSVTGEMTEDSRGNIWICTEGGGVSMYSPEKDIFRWFMNDGSSDCISHNHAKCILYDDDRNAAWIGTHLGGFNRLDLDSGRFTHYNSSGGLPSDIVMKILKDGNSLILATLHGIARFFPETGKYSLMIHNPDIRVDYIYDIMLDSTGKMWIICNAGKKLQCYDIRTDSLVGSKSLDMFYDGSTNTKINSVYEGDNMIWICTDGGGLYLYDPVSESIRNFDCRNSRMPSDVVYNIIKTASGRYIITTDYGLTIFSPDQKSFSNYSRNLDIPLSTISKSALFQASSGEIFIGGMDGMISFYEDILEQNSDSDCKLIPYALHINGIEVTAPDSDILRKDISATDAVVLKHDQNTITLKYTLTDYFSSDRKELEYRLDGYSPEWIPMSGNYQLTYPKLPPGKYSLTVRTKDTAGIPVKEHTLDIRVRPPFYTSVGAYILYICIIGTVTTLILREYKIRIRYAEQVKYEKNRAEDTEKLNRDKLQFFTNISHEFRTPLSIIIGQMNVLMAKYANSPIYASLSRIYRSCEQLSGLIDELLEFRKLDRGFIEIKARPGDLVSFLHGYYAQYQKIAEARKLNFHFAKSHDEIMVWFDGKQMQKVVHNLLSNAFKYVDEGGTITINVRKGNGEALFEVTNSGSYIAKEDVEKIFERFYQAEGAKAGTGIGLNLAKGIVELHHGKIEAYSQPEGETTFCVHLLLGNSHFSPEEIAPEGESAPVLQPSDIHYEVAAPEEVFTGSETADRKYTLLIVEDDSSLRGTLAEIFSPFYRILTASDGREGLEAARKEKPDIIVSDVFMPEVNGIEMCSALKSDKETCLIPVVLLTAATDNKQVIEGLDAGADDYIEKPFDVKVLISRCNNLVKNRLKIGSPAPQEKLEATHAFASTIQDQDFINKARKIVMDHIEDEDLDVNSFAREIGVSRTLLFTRIKNIAGQTPMEFIHGLKMETAASLLKEKPELSVTQVAERVGFSSLKRFRKCFKEKYGVTPTEYRGMQR